MADSKQTSSKDGCFSYRYYLQVLRRHRQLARPRRLFSHPPITRLVLQTRIGRLISARNLSQPSTGRIRNLQESLHIPQNYREPRRDGWNCLRREKFQFYFFFLFSLLLFSMRERKERERKERAVDNIGFSCFFFPFFPRLPSSFSVRRHGKELSQLFLAPKDNHNLYACRSAVF